ncbi:MAG TPA: bis(5'-nucleosyl)-tetraphosphatase (symmetrical) YqeK [Bacilli bacterium]|nr:bis(5'-nucleosyl)-tetraphosphatase (symmetrical) YqeK [Bacilli bacterium]
MNSYQEKVRRKLYASSNGKGRERYLHSLGVAKAAVILAQKFYPELDMAKVHLTGLIHDYAKYETLPRYKEIVSKYQLDKNIFQENDKIYHAILGCYIVKEELAIEDEEILKAILYHAFGNGNMTPLEEVIYLGDFIEENRQGSIFVEVRRIAATDIKQAIALEAKFVLEHLSSRQEKIHPNAFLTYQGYKKYLKED